MPIFRPTPTVDYSIIDPVQSSLDEDIVFGDQINPKIIDGILDFVQKIEETASIDVEKVWWVGSSLTYQWSEDSDIDITLFIDHSFKDQLKELNAWVHENYDGSMFVKKHPVNFHFATGRYERFKADAIYDVIKRKWIKKPKEVDESEIAEIISHCSDFKEFNDIMEKYIGLQDLLENYSGSRDQLSEIIDKTVDVLVLFEKIRQIRRDDFNKKPDKNLPSANYRCSNIVYKLLEKFGLGSLAETVASVLQQGFDN